MLQLARGEVPQMDFPVSAGRREQFAVLRDSHNEWGRTVVQGPQDFTRCHFVQLNLAVEQPRQQMRSIVEKVQRHQRLSAKFNHLNLMRVRNRPDSNLVALHYSCNFSIRRNRCEAHFLVHDNLGFQLRFGSDYGPWNTQRNSGEKKSSSGEPAVLHHSRSRHSSKFTAACIIFGSPVSTTGRTSSRLFNSGSRVKFLSGSPSNTGSVAKYSCVTSVLCPGALTR